MDAILESLFVTHHQVTTGPNLTHYWKYTVLYIRSSLSSETPVKSTVRIIATSMISAVDPNPEKSTFSMCVITPVTTVSMCEPVYIYTVHNVCM